MRKPIKTRKHRARKNRVRKHKTRKCKTRKCKTRKRKVRKHKTRKRKGGGEGQPQESQSDCAQKCENYKVGDEITYTHYRMGHEPTERTGRIVEIGKPSYGLNSGECCYIIATQGPGRQSFKYQVHCDDRTIRKRGEDVPEPVRRRGPGQRRAHPSSFGLNQGINSQQGSGQK